MAQDTVVEISHVWKIFGARSSDALKAVQERGLTKAEILKEYGAVVGVADVSLSVNRGEIFASWDCRVAANLPSFVTSIAC